jgi:hypothetical protein
VDYRFGDTHLADELLGRRTRLLLAQRQGDLPVGETLTARGSQHLLANMPVWRTIGHRSRISKWGEGQHQAGRSSNGFASGYVASWGTMGQTPSDDCRAEKNQRGPRVARIELQVIRTPSLNRETKNFVSRSVRFGKEKCSQKKADLLSDTPCFPEYNRQPM